MRSLATREIDPCSRSSARRVSGSREKPSSAAKRTARNSRSASSEKRVSGSPTQRSRPSRRSCRPPNGFDEALRFAVGHRVDRKVAPGEVLLDRGGERDAVGPSAVRIAAVDAERRDFIRLAVEQHGHGAVADAGFDDREVPENGLRFRGARVGRNVPVVRRAAEQAVAHAAAYGIGAMPGVRQARQNRPAGRRAVESESPWDHIVSESWRSFTPRRSPCCATRSRT